MIVEALIVETQDNISRGFALAYDQEVSVEGRHCAFSMYGEDDFMCSRVDVNDIQRPVAINLDAERAELESLLKQRERLVPLREAEISACITTFPE
jgi:hypothetical protein